MSERPVSLIEAGQLSIAQVGGKARALGRLSAAGFPVPEGFCLPATLFAEPALEEGSTGLQIETLDQVRTLWETLKAPHGVAVRSSANSEDGLNNSAAGQYVTILNVRSFDDLLNAIGNCRRSQSAESATQYFNRLDVDSKAVRMSVVVQAMVAPRWAGVIFTAEAPAADNDHTILVEAIEGLGDRLVDGLEDPDRAILLREEPFSIIARSEFNDGTAQLGDDELRRLARVAFSIEQEMGSPQDIEWALSEDGLHILQSRPITAPLPPPTGPSEWVSEIPNARWARMSICDAWLSDPLSPLFATTLFPRLIDRWTTNWGGPPAHRARSPLIPDPMHGTVNGFAYLRFDFPLSRHPLRTLQLILRWLSFHVSPVERLWRDEVLPSLQAELADALKADLGGLESTEVLHQVEAISELSARYWAVIGGLAWHWNASEWLLAAALRLPGVRKLGITTGSLLTGDDRLAHQMDRALDAIAAAAPDDQEPLLESHLATYGHLVYNLDFAEPTAAEDPAVLRAALDSRRSEADGTPVRVTANFVKMVDPTSQFRASLAGKLLRPILNWADHWSKLRDTVLHLFTIGWPFMRKGYLELGARMVADETLQTADDVFYLTCGELNTWVRGYDTCDHRDLVRERRGRRVWQQRLTPPDVVPAKARILLFGVDITALALFGVTTAVPEGGLSGSAVSPGHYSGPARVLHEVSQASELQRGEVLVVRHVTPAWAPLLARAGAVVSDVGGALSHGSVVAREYAIPAVMGTKNATTVIASGDIVTVNGDTGIVRVTPHEQP